MGQKRCSVAGCLSAKNRVEDTGVTYHQLPARQHTRDIWMRAACVPDDNNIKVCSRHFREADFKLVNSKYFLIKGCYPTIFPWGVFTNEPVAEVKSEPPVSTEPSSTTAVDPPAEPSKSTIARVNRESLAAKRHSMATVDVTGIKKEPVDNNNVEKPLQKSTESTPVIAKKDSDGPPKRVVPVPGTEVSAMDFQNVWHKAKIVEVDSVERELLIHYEEDNQQKLVDEWIPMTSSRLKPLTDDVPAVPEKKVIPPAKTVASTKPVVVKQEPVVMAGPSKRVIQEPITKFRVNEKCLARWSDSRKFKATVKTILPNGNYEVLFDDGFLKTVKLKHMSKLKNPRSPIKKGSTLPPVSLVDGEEWFCQWVDDCPLGVTTLLEGIPAQVRVIQVDDSRLPSGWTKYFSERFYGGTKWDIMIAAPCGRRFRGRQDIRTYILEMQLHKLDIADFDFAMHKKRAKEKGVYTYTDAYRKFLKAIYPSMAEIDTIPPTPADIQEIFMAQQPPMLLEPLPEVVVQDFIMVDGMKVQIIDNLLRCPEEGCLKNFRKENLLKIHIKHYHEDMAKKITAPPTMTDLAYIRTQGFVGDDPTVVRTPPATDITLSPQKTVRKEKIKTTPDTSMDLGVVIKEELIEADQDAPQQSLLEQALNSGAVTVKTEEVQEKLYPRATPITGTHNNSSGKRKHIRKTNEFDTQQKLAKKIKMEELSSLNDSMAVDIISPEVVPTYEVAAPLPPQPQTYINEHGELIKIVRMRQEEIINCLCHYPEEDGLMIQCDLCLCWQHGRCNDIEKESQVPDKYVCYICRNPEKARESMRYVHDQDWLLDGKLPRATYHTQGTANDAKRTEALKRVNTLTGNLLELKRLMHSLRVKMDIVDNKDHPKLYLWSKRWEATNASDMASPQKGGIKDEDQGGPKPEAAIDSRECQRRLMEHIKHVQAQLAQRMDTIEQYVDELEAESELGPMTEEEDLKCTPRIKQTVHMMMDDLTTMKEIALC